MYSRSVMWCVLWIRRHYWGLICVRRHRLPQRWFRRPQIAMRLTPESAAFRHVLVGHPIARENASAAGLNREKPRAVLRCVLPIAPAERLQTFAGVEHLPQQLFLAGLAPVLCLLVSGGPNFPKVRLFVSAHLARRSVVH